ncbi:MAG: PmoA family protein [Pirellulaceae bacterium]|nr:PmoA family protein [Pirellulaceae bacterium]
MNQFIRSLQIVGSTWLMICSTWLVAQTAWSADPVSKSAFRIEPITDQSLGVWEGEKPVLVYNHGMITKPGGGGSGGARPRACYLHPVYGLDGEVLTDDFPKDHVYHRGAYWDWTHIKLGSPGQVSTEYDLWSNNGAMRQEFQRWLDKEVTATSIRMGVENGWMVGDKLLVREQLWLHIHAAQGDSRAIDVRLVWTPIDQELTLSGAEGKSYGGFNFRFAARQHTVITVPEKVSLPEGVTTTNAGRTSGDLLVTRLPWADFCGDFGIRGGSEIGGMSGASIFVHPGHRDFPPTWMTRHYGLLSVGWPGVTPQTFPANQPIECQYRIWIHRGQPTAYEIQQAYDVYKNQ